MDEGTLLTTEEVAQALRLKAQSVRKWRLTGYGPRFIKIGGRVRYALADVNDFIARCAARTTAEARSKQEAAR
jgi:predicted DNA-binding transcriptional regulator AlpA